MIKIHNIIRNLSISLLCILLLYNASYKDLFNCHVFATLRQRTIPQKSQYVFANSTSSQTLSSVIIPPFHVSCCSLQPKNILPVQTAKKKHTTSCHLSRLMALSFFKAFVSFRSSCRVREVDPNKIDSRYLGWKRWPLAREITLFANLVGKGCWEEKTAKGFQL